MGTKITATQTFWLYDCPEDDTISLQNEHLFGDLNRFSVGSTEPVFYCFYLFFISVTIAKSALIKHQVAHMYKSE